jgi:hypothetical protein
VDKAGRRLAFAGDFILVEMNVTKKWGVLCEMVISARRIKE